MPKPPPFETQPFTRKDIDGFLEETQNQWANLIALARALMTRGAIQPECQQGAYWLEHGQLKLAIESLKMAYHDAPESIPDSEDGAEEVEPGKDENAG